MSAWYNENDPEAVAVLRQMIAEGHIAPGVVDERSIEDVRPVELLGYTQCHFFAGGGFWSYCARKAGWPDDRPLWTGSCPCGPFSAAGKKLGFADERHLWPAFFHLVEHAKPHDVPLFGEQVASKDGLAWLDLVQADMEAQNHAVWAFDLCAAGFGAPIIRQRLFWVALSNEERCGTWSGVRSKVSGRESGNWIAEQRGSTGRLDRPFQSRLEGHAGDGDREAGRAVADRSVAEAGALDGLCSTPSRRFGVGGDEAQPRSGGHADGAIDAACGMAESDSQRLKGEHALLLARGSRQDCAEAAGDSADRRPSPVNGFWRASDWLYCRDDKWRPVEPGAFVLAHGYPERTGLLRLAGNAINLEVATAFIEAYLEATA